MRIVKRLLVTTMCAMLSKFAWAQINLPDTIRMYTNNKKFYLDNCNSFLPDTICGTNKDGRFEEQALTLTGTKKRPFYDVLSMCQNRSTPDEVKLIRIGNNLFRIGNRIIVKIDDNTLRRFEKSFEHPRHCDHSSHASHYSSL